MVFIDKWPLFGGYLFYLIKERLLKCGLYLQGDIYSQVAFNKGLSLRYESYIYFQIFTTTFYPYVDMNL